jgi:hypothetical protein
MLEEQLNTTCNMLANSAVPCTTTLHSPQIVPALLPFECVAVVVEEVKITSQVEPTPRFALKKAVARWFY